MNNRNKKIIKYIKENEYNNFHFRTHNRNKFDILENFGFFSISLNIIIRIRNKKLNKVKLLSSSSEFINNYQVEYIELYGLSLLLLMKYLFEGFRFNSFLLIITYFSVFYEKVFKFNSYLSYISVIVTFLYLWSQFNQKHFSLPKPTGQFRTCYKQIQIKDKYSTSVSVYYPCLNQNQNDIDYKWLPDVKYSKQIYERMQLQFKWVPYQLIFDFGLSFLNYITFKASIEQPIMNKNLDVVIVSHGFTQHRNAYTFLCQELASEGYVVFSLQHTEMVYPWDLKQTKILNSGNKPEVMEKYQNLRATHLNWRCEQVMNLIQQIKFGQINDIFDNFNPLSINLIGHSFGGATVLKVAQNIQIDSVISFDPWLFPFNKDDFLKQVKGRTLILSKDINRKFQQVFEPKLLMDFLKNNNVDHYRIKGLDHAYPNDLTFLFPIEMAVFGELRTTTKVYQINKILISITKKYIKSQSFNNEEINQFC
ncbi:unnamed protein product [Paramecium sonneborni]|uniref:1-alkyl-2-acetylglycerophosphocholine esterase n=1 Tax=Paramecium sonneborni TaxID=65129 RepID=A0A8S1QYF7_9CILI|nr:unnamed protein product [Paramecium sonneborni]